ncbi:MAG: DNA mismatch repair protein MutS [Anaerolineae bacterium]
MRQQYLALKRQYPDVILFFRLGDFYETFDEDALTVSEVCDITLTSRPVGKDTRVPLAGVPYHAADTYIARLVKAGYKIAIAEQSDSSDRSLMQRQVVRVITPGTVTEDFLLAAKSNNYLVGLVVGSSGSALAYTDISTGEFVAEDYPRADEAALRDALARLSAAECVVSESDSVGQSIARTLSLPLATVDAWRVSSERAREVLLQHFGAITLAPFGLEGHTEAMQAAALCLLYLHETQPAALPALESLRFDTGRQFMYLDYAVQRNLELTAACPTAQLDGSLLAVLDQTVTPMGARLLRQRLLKPALQVDLIEHRLDGLDSFFTADTLRSRVREVLHQMPDLERLSARLRQGHANPRHLLAIAGASASINRLQGLLNGDGIELKGEAGEAASCLDAYPEARALIEAAIADDAPATVSSTGVIRPGFNSELDAITNLATNAHRVLADLETKERERSGIKSLRIGHNNVFGYYIEVPQSQAQRVPADYVRKQTLTTGERYFTEQLKAIEASIYSAQERRLALERELWAQVLEQVATSATRLSATARAIAVLDVLCSLAEVARSNGYTRPQVNDGLSIEITAGRHPVVEQALRREGRSFVANDVHLSNTEEAILVITGPNMAGKSTYLRQVALIVLMAQIGSYVPAASATIGLVDRIFARIGAQDELAAGQSTFMVEMVETANILRQASERSLIILDEVGRGTSTYDGMAIARAVVEHIHNSPRLGCKTLFATHYHELTDMEQYLPRVRNYNVAVAEEASDVVFLHRIVRGGADRSYGIHVARLAGVPREVLKRAADVLRSLEAQQQLPTAPPPVTPSARQLALFSSADEGLISELSQIEVERLTPLEALVQLASIRDRARQLQQPGKSRR